MRKYLIVTFLALLILAPLASAKIVITAEPLGVQSTTYKQQLSFTQDLSSQNYALQRVTIDAPIGTDIDYTITYGDGRTVSGEYSYTDVSTLFGVGTVRSYIALGGNTSQYDYIGSTAMGRVYITGYAHNQTEDGTITSSGLVVFGGTFGLSTIQNDYVYYPVSEADDGVMYKISLTSNKPVNINVMTNPREDVAKAKNKDWLQLINEWVNLIISIADTVKTLVLSAIYWGKFFFIDNLTMTIAGYIMITGAFAAKAARGNISRFFSQWISNMLALFRFIMDIFKWIVEIISLVRGIFRI